MNNINGGGQAYIPARMNDESPVSHETTFNTQRADSDHYPLPEDMDFEDASTLLTKNKLTKNKKLEEPSYDAFFVNDDQNLEELLPYLKQQYPGSFISLVRSPEDMDTDNLTEGVEVKGTNTVVSCDGRLFGANADAPVVLVLDFRNIHPSRRAELNWLFDKEPRLGNRVIRGNVHIVSLLTDTMLPGTGNNTDKPGPDFWRRINKPDNHWSTADLPEFHQNVSLSAELDTRIPEYSFSKQNEEQSTEEQSIEVQSIEVQSIEIDLFGKNWRSELFGSPGIDDQSAIVFHQGRLNEIKENTRVILRGAPWQDPQFTLHLWSVLHDGQYEANGIVKKLPDNIQWFRKSISAHDLETLKRCVTFASEVPADHNVAIINEDNFNACLQDAVITSQGRIMKSDVLEEWCKDAAGIRITSALNQSQWITLLRRLESFDRKAFPIYIDNPEVQPENFRGIAAIIPELTPARGVKLLFNSELTYELTYKSKQDNVQKPSLDIVVSLDCSLEKIVFDSGIESMNKGLFRQDETDFLSALRTGKKIRLKGLENNPALTRQLETLLLPDPYLLIGGKKEYFTNARIDVIWPPGAKSSSPLWGAVINKAESNNKANQPWQKKLLTTQKECETNPSDDLLPPSSKKAKLDHSSLPLKPPREFDQVLEVLKKLPLAQRAPAELPGSIIDVRYKVSLQARIEQQLDGADQPASRHWRKAISSVLLKEYRGNPEVYSFLKVQISRLLKDEQNNVVLWINSDDIRQWLLAHPTLNRATIEANFWQLMRHVDPRLFKSLPDEYKSIMDSSADQISLKRLTSILVCCATPERQAELAFSLKISPNEQSKTKELLSACNHHSQQLTKQLEDFLHTLGEQRSTIKPLSDQAQELASNILQIRNNKHSAGEKTEHTLKLLAGVISSGNDVITMQSLAQLANTLANDTGKIDWHCWEQRRIKRLAAKVADSRTPVVFIKGEAGAGKSFIAGEIARYLNLQYAHAATTLTVGPGTTTDDLFGREQPQQAVSDQSPDSSDTCTQFIDGPLMQWAKQRSGRPLVFVIDEANLVKPEIWDCLKGMYEQPPCLYHHGRRVPLTDTNHPQLMHRIIMTGNPDHFSGRHMNTFLRSRAPQLYYKPLAETFQSEKVLKPELKQLLPEEKFQELGQKTCDTIMQLVDQYRPLLLNHEFTPRDLTDITARMARYLNITAPAQITMEQLSAVVWQSVADTLAGAVDTKKRYRFVALEAWFHARFQPDDSIVRCYLKKFEDFYTSWKLHQLSIAQEPGIKRFDLSNGSVKHLAKQLWLELDRATCEKNKEQPHHGRHATLVEGPAGRGKDRLLELLIHEWNRQFGTSHKVYSVTGGVQNWGALRKAIQSAKEKGHWLLVPELNMLKTEYLEGAMNDVLTGNSARGFHLFATVNPISFSGRQALSPALQSRFTTVKIGDYNASDLKKISSVLIIDPDVGQQVSQWHYQLLQRLKEKKLPILPTVGNIAELAEELNAIKPVSSEALKEHFARHYQLFMKCAGVSMDDLSQSSEQKLAEAETNHLPELTQWLNHSFSSLLTRPISIFKSSVTNCDLSNGSLMLNTGVDNSQWKLEAVTSIVKHLWTQADLPLDSPDDHDILFTACFKRWQQQFADQILGGMDIEGSQLFKMTLAESETLKLKNNGAYLKRLDILMSQQPSPWRLHQFREALLTPAAGSEGSLEDAMAEDAVAEDAVAEDAVAEVTVDSCPPPKRVRIDGHTKPCMRHRQLKQTFKKNKPREVRKNVMRLDIAANGTVQSQSIDWGYFGFEVMTPIFTDPSGMSATYKQDVGLANMTLTTDNWQALPGLWPQENVVAVYATPECEIEMVRDRFTQLHLVRAKNQDSAKPVSLYYVLEPNKPKGLDASPRLLTPENQVMPAYPQALKDSLDQLFREQPQLHSALWGKTTDETIAKLVQYCQSFKADEELGGQADVNLLIQLIKNKQGSCRHRSEAFYALAWYFGIPVKMVISDCHKWVEASTDDGRTWEKYDLGGADHEDTTMKIVSVNNIPMGKSVKLSRSVLKNMLGDGNKNIGLIAKNFGVTEAQLQAYLSGGGNSQLTISEEIDPDALEEELLYRVNPHSFMTGLSMLQGSEHFNPFKYNGLCFLLADHVSQDGPLTPEVLCDFLHNAHIRLADPGSRLWNGFIQNILEALHTKKNYSVGEKVAAFCLLDQCWLTLEESLYGLHWLAKSTVYGESAKSRLTPFYDQLVKPANIIAGVSQHYEIPKKPPSDIPLEGYSSSLECRLKSSDINEAFSWQPVGVLSVNRYIKQKAPFSHQKAEMSQKPVVGLVQKNYDFKKIFDKCDHLALRTKFSVEDDEKGKEKRYETLYCASSVILDTLPSTVRRDVFESLRELAHKCKKGLEREQFEAELDFILASSYCAGIDKESYKNDCLSAFDEYHRHPLQASADIKTVPLKPALYYAFLEYFCEQTGATNGHLKVFHASQEARYTGWSQPETPKTLHSCLLPAWLSPVSEMIEDERLKKVSENPNMLIIKPDELEKYFLEFYESLNIEKMIREKKIVRKHEPDLYNRHSPPNLGFS